jgi:SET domain-containing protein
MLNSKAEILKNLQYNSNVYLRPSKVCDGVGAFALVPIPKDTLLFKDVPSTSHYFTWEELKNIPKDVLDKLKSLCPIDKEGIYLFSSLNNFNFSYFINHSYTPNVVYDADADEFYTLRNIKKDEELVCTYPVEEMDWID